jgi:CoA:oxalate CoA-transferase
MNPLIPGGNSGPLKSVKVVDLTRALAGPTCTMILADMGAETLKVEQPLRKGNHQTSEPSAPPQPQLSDRNKKSITLDLRKEKAKEIFSHLIRWADVVVENYRPGLMARMGFDFPAMQKINPPVILTSISGYGQPGPYAQRAAFDSVGQAMGGLMSVTGPADMPPMDAGAAVSDISAGIFGALGTVLALYHQKSTGLGQQVDVSLIESIICLMAFNLQLRNIGNAPGKGALFSPKRTPGAGMFLTKDGVNLIIMAHTDQHWPIMARLIGREDLASDPDYRVRHKRAKHGDEIAELIAPWVRQYMIDEVESILDRSGLPFGRVQSLEDLLIDPHLKARNRFLNYEYLGKMFPMIAPFPILSETPGAVRTLWPTIGQHNEEIYHQLLGYPLETLNTLKAEGVI